MSDEKTSTTERLAVDKLLQTKRRAIEKLNALITEKTQILADVLGLKSSNQALADAIENRKLEIIRLLRERFDERELVSFRLRAEAMNLWSEVETLKQKREAERIKKAEMEKEKAKNG